MARDFKSRFILQGEDRAAAAFQSVERSAGRTIAKLAGFAAAGLAIRSVVNNTREAISEFDEIAKKADSIGIATDELQALRHAAEESGVEVARLDKAMQDFVRRTGEAAAGTGQARLEYERLGIDIHDANGHVKNAETLLGEVADKFAATEDQAVKARIAYNLFGRAGVDITNMLRGGSEALEDWRREARDAGIIVDEHMLRSSEKLNDELALQQKIIDKQLAQAFVALGPILVETVKTFAEMAVWLGKVVDRFRDVEDISLRNLNKQIAESTQKIIDLKVQIAGAEPATAFEEMTGGFSLTDAIDREFKKRAALIEERQRRENERRRDLLKDAPVVPVIGDTEAEKRAAEREAARKAREEQREADRIAALTREKEEFTAHLLGIEAEEVLHFERRREQLQQFRDEGIIGEEQHKKLLEELELQHQEELTRITLEGLTEREKFARMKTRDQVQHVLGGIADMTAGVAHQNKVLFEINKIAAIGEATVDAIKGAEKTWDAYPFPINVAMTAIHVAASVARIAAIKSQQFGGGGRGVGAARGGGGGRPAPVTQQLPPPERDRLPRGEVVIRLEGRRRGQRWEDEEVRELIDVINDVGADGHSVRISG